MSPRDTKDSELIKVNKELDKIQHDSSKLHEVLIEYKNRTNNEIKKYDNKISDLEYQSNLVEDWIEDVRSEDEEDFYDIKEQIIENVEDINIFNERYEEIKKTYKTSKYLNKYEKSKILSERVQQLANNSKPLNPSSTLHFKKISTHLCFPSRNRIFSKNIMKHLKLAITSLHISLSSARSLIRITNKLQQNTFHFIEIPYTSLN